MPESGDIPKGCSMVRADPSQPSGDARIPDTRTGRQAPAAKLAGGTSHIPKHLLFRDMLFANKVPAPPSAKANSVLDR